MTAPSAPGPGRKVLILGLDGATFDLMLPWVETGLLPNLAKLVGRGARSPLRSTIPPITPCAWTSFMTGKNPGKHGLFDFVEPVPGSYDFRFTNATARRAESLWAYLGRLGRKVGVMNVPMTYPPEPVNGWLISGLDTPDERSPFVFPAGLLGDLRAQGIHYRLDLQHLGDMNTDERRDRRLKDFREVEDERSRALAWLRRRFDPDFAMVVYNATDQVQHHFWHYMDPAHDLHDARAAERYRHAIRDIYVHIDGLIGLALETVDDDTAVIVMSDHGFGPTSSLRLRLNQAFEGAGLLGFERRGLASRALRPLAGALDGLLRTSLSPDAKRRIASLFPRLRVRFESMNGKAGLDWGRTRVFTNEVYNRSCPTVWVNRRGTYPQGTVEGETAVEEALRAAEETIRALRDPKTGRQAVSHVYRSRDLYHGPFAERAPDLIPSWWEDGFLLDASAPGGGSAGTAFRSTAQIRGGIDFAGSHRIDGVFLVAGGPARRGHAFGSAEIIDVAPTVLYLMGLPIPGDMDGRPLLEALDPAYVAANPPRYDRDAAPPESGAPSGQAAREAFTDDEAKSIEERLRALGYIE